jgi:hypothetical protein
MPNLEVRDIPADVHQELVRKAEQAGQSLQKYLASQLELIATTPTLDEALDRIERRAKGALTAVDAIAALEDDRARR